MEIVQCTACLTSILPHACHIRDILCGQTVGMSQLLSFGFVLKSFWSWSSCVGDKLKCLCKNYTCNWGQELSGPSTRASVKIAGKAHQLEIFSKGEPVWVAPLKEASLGDSFQTVHGAWTESCLHVFEEGKWGNCGLHALVLHFFKNFIWLLEKPLILQHWVTGTRPGWTLGWYYTERPLQSWTARSGLSKKRFLRHLFFSSNPLCYS